MWESVWAEMQVSYLAEDFLQEYNILLQELNAVVYVKADKQTRHTHASI